MKSDSEVILFEIRDILEQEKIRKTPIIYRPCDCWKNKILIKMLRADSKGNFWQKINEHL